MSLLANLPAPTKQHAAPILAVPASSAIVSTAYKEPPPYLRRQGWVPRRAEDFGDGGAFPEIHVAQYPLDMGKGGGAKGNQQLAVTLNADGQINYDAVVKQGSNRDRIVHSDHSALVPKVDRLSKEALARPDDEEVEKTIQETAAALERVVQGKLSSTNPSKLPNQPGSSTLIKYTPAQQGAQYASGAGQRIIKMQDLPVDPLEPPKFRHVKVPRGPGSPPVPVLHSPPRPLSVKDQQDWKIPPSISNWKNPKGYTIPLDKRLAADGRGLQQTQINDKFAALSEALFTAEAKAREAIAMRASIQKELALKEKNKREAELRQLAMQARMERQGAGAGAAGGMAAPPPPPPPSAGGAAARGTADRDRDYDRGRGGGDDERYRETVEEREERRRRDEIREERRRERERERRLEAANQGGAKKSKITRDRERDISEKVALGMANVGAGGEVQYDQRLFNQDAGMQSGFGPDDAYNMYDKPLFADRGSHLFKASRATADDEDLGPSDAGPRTDRFRPDKGFEGAEPAPGAAARGGGGRLEFERQAAAAEEADPFGLDQFLSEVKGGGRERGGRKGNALDAIGQRGGMSAAGGGASFEDAGAGAGMGRRMQFTSGSGR
ncbi:hypothetical protein VOLCADRAFT_69109 [Volvox carteri f. nagariensis]|uniref:SKI-interacting protein SKIP SNW domain-containing protein n=1 Tax=Volvox carteri f. nagariensis TaxID=3068 RepID=D8UHM3_VOLCA|nr:uncharacterized protein VOLCADRAFT_69109 [Volvox carteri f. nagariensis]EFJ40771.1 hypothetical protein VOLCADRAFT_69109 [Volvox carteri f. nagariensis]|eukprot:XP_002958146.1 hypothetical protein VOLCADRAFT_69109 [Volvox carteri f. nagariensis]